MPHKRNHGNNRINRLINQFITNVPELRVPTPEDIEDAIVVLKEVVGNLDFYYGFVDEEWQEVINVDTARELLYQYLNEYLLLGDNPAITPITICIGISYFKASFLLSIYAFLYHVTPCLISSGVARLYILIMFFICIVFAPFFSYIINLYCVTVSN